MSINDQISDECYIYLSDEELLVESSLSSSLLSSSLSSSPPHFLHHQSNYYQHGLLTVLGYSEYRHTFQSYIPVGKINNQILLERKLIFNDYDKEYDIYQIGKEFTSTNDLVIRGFVHVDLYGNISGPMFYGCRIACERSYPHRIYIHEGVVDSNDILKLPSHSNPNCGITLYHPQHPQHQYQNDSFEYNKVCVNGYEIIYDGTIIDLYGIKLLYSKMNSRLDYKLYESPIDTINRYNKLNPYCSVLLQSIHFDYQPTNQKLLQLYNNLISGRNNYQYSISGNIIIHNNVRNHNNGNNMNHNNYNNSNNSSSTSNNNYNNSNNHISRSSNSSSNNNNSSSGNNINRAAYVFPQCGHVFGFASDLETSSCPLCRTKSQFTSLSFQFCNTIDNSLSPLHYIYNPCGCITSLRSAIKFSSSSLDHIICPYCATPLNKSKPYTKLLVNYYDEFQHNSENDDGVRCRSSGSSHGNNLKLEI